MISNKISDLILERLTDNDLVVDIGGARYPWFRANYIIDKREYEQKIGEIAFCGNDKNKKYFTRETWISHDFYDLPWPIEDNYFDFSLCMGTLEDIRDPIRICKEIQRISKAGYISTPTRAAESYLGLSKHPMSNQLYGYYHHRWFVEIMDSKLIFKVKTPLLYQHRQWSPSRIGQHTLNFFWEENFEVKEQYLSGHENDIKDLELFFNKHENWLNTATINNKYDYKLYNQWVDHWGAAPSFQEVDNYIEKSNKKNNYINRLFSKLK